MQSQRDGNLVAKDGAGKAQPRRGGTRIQNLEYSIPNPVGIEAL